MTAIPSEVGRQGVTEAASAIEPLQASLAESLSLHTAMFERLLFEEDDLPLELGELLEDVANRYLTFSESISRLHLARRFRDRTAT